MLSYCLNNVMLLLEMLGRNAWVKTQRQRTEE